MQRSVLRANELALRLAISKSTLWRWCKSKSNFPQPRKISQGVTVWFAEEVQEWLNSQNRRRYPLWNKSKGPQLRTGESHSGKATTRSF